MSDDLVKRLRDGCSCNIDSTPCMAEEECRDAYTAADRIEELGQACAKWAEVSQSNYQRAKAAEAKLAKAVEVLRCWVALVDHCNIETGFCCCGEEMENHSSPMNCGHAPVDQGSYVALGLFESTSAFLATIHPEGETDDKA